ncbi:transglycosylase domain-containing protein [Magnetospirillum moscoviense]|uniref:Carboxypeptidase n=1 Tax=Magnetospirillum moscoviense TaxID=1437059 RepID=A0A178MTD8_9PROT|nr:PBP1A family penicillin-binding protein [Magnetospirillum moscoviense]OAN53091.1 carboxypeptidase [Magnetospirillum moscoviense]
MANDKRPRPPTLTLDPSDRLVSSADGPAAAPPPPRKPAAPKRPRKSGGGRPKHAWLKRLVLWGVTAAIWVGVGVAGLVAWYAMDLPDIDGMTTTTRRPAVVFQSANGETFATFGDVYGRPLELAEMAPTIAQAVIATEDRRFYRHFGLDAWGLARAAFTNARAGRVVQGGSTITQQLAKNLFLTPDRTLKRKVQELLMALWLERRFTKEQILTIYLNRVYLGSGTFGVDAAAKRYFDVSASRLDLYQSAVLAGLLKAPSRYSPLNDPEASHKRTLDVLSNMVEAGFIERRDADLAALTGAARAVKRPVPTGRYFADWVMSHLSEMGDVQGRDIVVHTTLDLGLQRKAEADLKALLDGPGAKAAATQGAVVVMAPDGAVRALVGGRDYDDSQFNRATQAQRQPGSSFKPFVYLAAMEQGLTPSDTFDDAPIKLGNWKPGNYNGKFEGPVTLRRAFAQSTNTVAVRLIEEVGPGRVINLAHKLGIVSELGRDASLALGTSETNLLELTTAYAAFANGGYGVQAFGVEAVTDPDGKVLWSRQGEGFGKVISDQALHHMQEMMSAVLSEGTGKGARLDRPAAGKTGTTQDYRDAWFMGFTADYVGGVWLGNDDQRHEMKKVTGGGLPATLWKSVMTAAHRGLPARPLAVPEPPPSAAAGTEGTAGEWPNATSGSGPIGAIGNAIDDLLNSIFGR